MFVETKHIVIVDVYIQYMCSVLVSVSSINYIWLIIRTFIVIAFYFRVNNFQLKENWSQGFV